MTDEQVEKIIKSNMMLQMNIAGIRADFEEALQRTWVGLSDKEIAEVEDEYIVDYRIPAGSAWNFAKDIEAILKKRNT
jgi:hypothetical protein